MWNSLRPQSSEAKRHDFTRRSPHARIRLVARVGFVLSFGQQKAGEVMAYA
jgi:hypothetical protein